MFADFLDTYCRSDHEGLRHVASAFRRNRHYIQNTWKYGRSNAVCEGPGNRIKVIKRNAYGQHSFKRFRQRILFACGGTRFVTDSYSIASLKNARTSVPSAAGDVISKTQEALQRCR